MALVSVLGIVVPQLVTAFRPPASDVRATVVSVQPIEVRPLPSYAPGKLSYVLPMLILVTNSGQRPALLTEGTVSVHGAGQVKETRTTQIEIPNDKSTLASLPLILAPGEFKSLRLRVELKPSDDLPQDWSRSEVRSSNELQRQVVIGGDINLVYQNNRADRETLSVNVPDQSIGFTVPFKELFETWRRNKSGP